MPSNMNTWQPFRWESYRYAWYSRKLFGVFRQFCDDLRCSYQRIKYGYCDYDLWNMYDWFLDLVPRMLEEHKSTRHGSPVVNEADIGNDEALSRAWDEVLDRMIFLFREASNETCTRTNPYADEYERISEEFREKYGLLGEKLMTDEEREDSHKHGGKRVHFPDELPEYKDIASKYFAECREIDSYREKSKDEAFALFAKYFYGLWD